MEPCGGSLCTEYGGGYKACAVHVQAGAWYAAAPFGPVRKGSDPFVLSVWTQSEFFPEMQLWGARPVTGGCVPPDCRPYREAGDGRITGVD